MSLLATLRAKKQSREVATLTVATPATDEGNKAPTVATVATVTVATAEITLEPTANQAANDGYVVMPTSTAGAAVHGMEAEADTDRWCWPHSDAMNGREIDTFTARLDRFTNKGVSHEDAERLGDKLVLRDREGDDRRLCLECNHLQGFGRWHCGKWQAAHMARQGLARDLVLMLQRCVGFQTTPSETRSE